MDLDFWIYAVAIVCFIIGYSVGKEVGKKTRRN